MLKPAGLQKAGAAAIAAGLAVWAVIDPHFRDAELLLTARACLPLALSAAFLVMAWSTGREWTASAVWLAVLIAGQAAALQLMQPTGHVGYQHYLFPKDYRTLTELFCILLIAAQACAVVIVLAPARGAILKWLASNFRSWQLVVIVLLATIAASAPSLDLFNYGFEFLLAGGIQFLGLLTVIALVRSIPPATLALLHQRLDAWQLLPDRDSQPQPGGIDRFAVLGALWVVAASTLLSFFVYERHPHIADEVVYLLHAKYLAHGMLAMPLPPVPEAFNIDLMIYQPDRWFSAFPPGWPAMLALGHVEATLLSEADRLLCRISGRGESTVSGELSLTRQGDYTMDLLLTPGSAVSVDVIDTLKTFGQARPGGAYQLTDSGRI